MFKNWIESGIITVNDIINDRGEISEGLILDKLRIKTNWINEVNIMYKSFPKEWKRILHENKNKKRFNQNSEFNIYNPIDKKETNLKDVNNKVLYQILLNRVTTKSFAIDTWVNEFNLTNAKKCMNAFKFISQNIAENDERIYRWKLLHRILPNGILMHQWKILRLVVNGATRNAQCATGNLSVIIWCIWTRYVGKGGLTSLCIKNQMVD